MLNPSLEKLEKPAVVRHVLPNGLTLLVLEDRSCALVAFHAVVRTGSATEGDLLGTGVSHVVEHMLFKGTARRPVGAVEREARSYGGTSQGYTSYDTTRYPLTVNEAYWPQAADLLVDALFFPSMDPQEFLKERDVVLRELRYRRDDPSQVAWDLMFSNAYRVHPYRLPIIGHEPLLMKLTAEELRRYHAKRYVPNEIVMAVVGPVDPQAVIRRFEELTGKIPPGRVPDKALPQEPLPASPRDVTEEAEVKLASITVGYPSISIHDTDLFALDLLAWILGGGRGSRLERVLKETGIVHSVSVGNYTPLEPGLFAVSMRADAEKVDEALQALSRELDQVKKERMPDSEIEAAKKAFLREYLQERQTFSGQASDLAGYEVLVGDPLFADRYLRQVSLLTPEDLRRAAQKYIQPTQATTVRLLPKKAVSAEKASKGGPAQALETQKAVLANGLTLILRPDRRIPLITFHVTMLGGTRFETEKTNGLSALTSRMLLRGTHKHPNSTSLVEELKRIGAELSPFSGRNSLGFTLQVVAAEAGSAVDPMTEILRESAFPAEELEKERRLGLAALKAQEEDPFSWAARKLVSMLFTRHPYRLDPLGNEGAWRKFTREDVLDFYRRVGNPKKMVVSVVGDFNPEEMRLSLDKALGSWTVPQEASPEIPAEPKRASPGEHRETTPRREAILMIGYPGITLDDPRRPEMDVAEMVMSGGGGRLFTEVREKRGLAYTVGAFAVPGLDPGFLVLYAITDPANLDQVRQAILEEVERMKRQAVPAQELEEAKQGLLGERRIARQSHAHLATQMAGDELYGLGFDYSEKYDAKIIAVTAEQIQAAVKDLLDPYRSVTVIGQPAESATPLPEQKGIEEETAPAGELR